MCLEVKRREIRSISSPQQLCWSEFYSQELKNSVFNCLFLAETFNIVIVLAYFLVRKLDENQTFQECGHNSAFWFVSWVEIKILAKFLYFSIVDDCNDMGVLNCTQPMGNYKHCSSFAKWIEWFLNQSFGFSVKCRSSFV